MSKELGYFGIVHQGHVFILFFVSSHGVYFTVNLDAVFLGELTSHNKIHDQVIPKIILKLFLPTQKNQNVNSKKNLFDVEQN